MTRTVIDLDASRRELTEPEGIPLVLRGQEFLLPAELPADALDPLLSEDLDLVGIVRTAAVAGKPVEGALAALLAPGTLQKILGSVHEVLALLFGADEYARFRALRPSLPDYGRVLRGLGSAYGVGLGEAFASLTSSESSGVTSKQTSPGTTPDSTPAPSGDDQGSAPGTSASGD